MERPRSEKGRRLESAQGPATGMYIHSFYTCLYSIERTRCSIYIFISIRKLFLSGNCHFIYSYRIYEGRARDEKRELRSLKVVFTLPAAARFKARLCAAKDAKICFKLDFSARSMFRRFNKGPRFFFIFDPVLRAADSAKFSTKRYLKFASLCIRGKLLRRLMRWFPLVWRKNF